MNEASTKWAYFIADQGWSLLTDLENPKQHLLPSKFRTGAQSPASKLRMEDASSDDWESVTRLDVLNNQVQIERAPEIDLSRLVVTTDAGVGKSNALEWMCMGLNRPDSGWLAFYIPPNLLSGTSNVGLHEGLIDVLASQIDHAAKEIGCRIDDARRLIHRFRRKGKLALFFDGLDQMASAHHLKLILDSDMWSQCRITIAGRPYAIQTHWDTLFRDTRWRYLRVDELTEEQQRVYLGTDSRGNWRYDEYVHQDAKPILSAPRVLSYLRRLSDEKLRGLSTASAIYYEAIRDMIRRGMENSIDARKFACKSPIPLDTVPDSQVRSVMKLLSLVAYQMTAQTVPLQDGNSQGPNFYGIPRGKMDRFEEVLQAKFSFTDFHSDWQALAALNTILDFSVFDGCGSELPEIIFSNKSLQEFLCGFYLAQHASLDEQTGGVKPDQGIEPQGLWNWIYLPLRPESDAYYSIWKYLIEMPTTKAIDERVWLESIAPLFYRCQGIERKGGKVEWIAKRSCEMMYRAMPWIEPYIKQGNRRAKEILSHWWSEFEDELLSGSRGEELRSIAMEIQSDLLLIPGGTFWMGSPEGKSSAIDPDTKALYERLIEKVTSGTTDVATFVARTWNFGVGKTALERQQEHVRFCERVVANGIDWLASTFTSRSDEHWHKETVESFRLARRPTLNRWIRLFRPDHGREPMVEKNYMEYSEKDNQPAIYVDFFMAHLYCKWLRWNDHSCCLPLEREWEYACKFGTDPRWDYWWGDTMEKPCPYANAMNELGRTSVPMSEHANPATAKEEIDPLGLGLMDILGNVWEWCEDIYERKHVHTGEIMHDFVRSRVLRGGGFYHDLNLCRSGCRSRRRPSFTSVNVGFRVSRAEL